MAAVSVRLLAPTRGLKQNEVVSVDEAVADRLVADHLAVVVESPKPAKKG